MIARLWSKLVAAIKAARATRAPDSIVVTVRPEDGPVVTAPTLKHPLPLTRVPARSTKRPAQNIAMQFARQHSGKPMTLRQSQKYIARLLRDEPGMEIPLPGDQARIILVGYAPGEVS
jgi:hypothetical protein